MSDPTLTPPSPSLQERILEALRTFDQNAAESPLADLFVFRQVRGARTLSSRQVTSQILTELLERLAQENHRGVYVMRQHYLQNIPVSTIAKELSVAESTAFRYQREAAARLGQILGEWEMTAQTELHRRLLARLEAPTNSQRFGIKVHLNRLEEVVTAQSAPWLIMIDGIGGIGKTTLADAFMRQAIAHYLFDDFAWVSARPQQFSLAGHIEDRPDAILTPTALLEALGRQILPRDTLPVPFTYEQGLPLIRDRLTYVPSLVVIDNLETITDLEQLLPTLIALSNPSKILLTSRKRMDHRPEIFPYHLQPLEQSDALALVRHEAAARNLPNLAAAEDVYLHPIYATVGGNPLALRLVVGLSTMHALHVVLAALRSAQGSSVDQLYTFIYRQAWDNLEEAARLTLLAMPLSPPEGVELAFLQAVSGLTPDQLMDGLTQLVRLNLIDARRSSLEEIRYTIHSLTRSFLHEQVARWQ